MLETKIELLMEQIERKKSVSLDELSAKLKWDSAGVERACKMLERKGIVELKYPISILEKPSVALKKPLEHVSRPARAAGELLESYRIVSDHVPSEIKIFKKKGEQKPSYYIAPPEIPPYTRLLLDSIRDEMGKLVTVNIDEIMHSAKSAEVKTRFYEVGKKRLQEVLPSLEGKDVEMLAGILLHETYGLGELELLLGDDNLEEVAVNNSQVPIAVYHKKYGWMESNLAMKNEDEIANYAMQIGRKAGRQISLLNPILDAHLGSGDRVYASLSPISTKGNTITIRRFARNPWTITDLMGEKLSTISSEMAAMLWQAIHYEMNIMVAGGTASGKTSMLNILCSFIPAYQRVVTIEDTRELSLPSFVWNWIPMLTRLPNPEGLGEVSMLDLMLASLRMRPDRIIVGEVRRRREAEVLFEAMHTGHAVCSTMHADTAAQVLRRLMEPPIEIPMVELESLHLLVIQYRDRRSNIRRTLEICEIVPGIGGERLSVNHIYQWRPRGDVFEKINEPMRIYEALNLHTGMTQKEIVEDLNKRKSVLEWMTKNNVNTIDKVGRVMQQYYNDPDGFMKENRIRVG
ncbi:MAG: Type II/IV secretion system protein [Candidatus Fermentimicrarchaeum limneticum]|uniref:Type II/IV secretion system protein n=1 Tax=Fermentimicrarchaeum limneticum TaxID=2795018 RepID=A0A7D6BSY6_FERL1|nr:MAG: Type II/IV secretion system protein [Candidatus Fermentimicrarchaeum limneticum]